jgi:hypothetical protein
MFCGHSFELPVRVRVSRAVEQLLEEDAVSCGQTFYLRHGRSEGSNDY